MASFFIPITFVAGVYGMNFEHIPSCTLNTPTQVFWVICLGMVGGLALYFRAKAGSGSEEIEADE